MHRTFLESPFGKKATSTCSLFDCRLSLSLGTTDSSSSDDSFSTSISRDAPVVPPTSDVTPSSHQDRADVIDLIDEVQKPSVGEKRKRSECPICMDEFDGVDKSLHAISSCGHVICKECFTRLPHRMCHICRKFAVSLIPIFL